MKKSKKSFHFTNSLGVYVQNESPVGIFCWKQATALGMLREPSETGKYMLPVIQAYAKTIEKSSFIQSIEL